MAGAPVTLISEVLAFAKHRLAPLSPEVTASRMASPHSLPPGPQLGTCPPTSDPSSSPAANTATVWGKQRQRNTFSAPLCNLNSGEAPGQEAPSCCSMHGCRSLAQVTSSDTAAVLHAGMGLTLNGTVPACGMVKTSCLRLQRVSFAGPAPAALQPMG